jgi:leishmanolysin
MSVCFALSIVSAILSQSLVKFVGLVYISFSHVRTASLSRISLSFSLSPFLLCCCFKLFIDLMRKTAQRVVPVPGTRLLLLAVLPLPSNTATASRTSNSSSVLAKTQRHHRCIHDELQQSVLEAVAVKQRLNTEQQQQSTDKPPAVSSLPSRSGLPFVTLLSTNSTGMAPARVTIITTTIISTSDTTITWGPLRVLISTLDITNSSNYCTPSKTYVANKQGGYVACTASDELTGEKGDILIHHLLPQALKMHTDRLQVRQTQGTWRVTDMSGICANFEVPTAHATSGVTDVDFIVYVAAVPAQSGVTAWANVCQVHADNRPAVGVINIPPVNLFSRYDQFMIRTVTQELAHALGFTSSFFTSSGISGSVTGLRGKTDPVPVITGETVVAKAREQYGCDTATYMEVEDQGTSGSVGSHWKMRNAQEELMAPASSAGYYTALTMAAFADMGFYKPHYGKAETMARASNAGYEFLTEKCMVRGVTKWPDMFCPRTRPATVASVAGYPSVPASL